MENIDGSIYVQVPQNPDAKFTITADGVTTGNPLVFTSKEFNNQYENSLKQGYYTSHDFRISGPVPTTPRRSGSYSGSSAGTGGMDLLSSKGPLFDLMTENSTSRVPLFISVPIIIAALLVLAYILKKKM